MQIKAIGLEDEIITTPKDSIAAKSRFVYYPDHLVRMPGPGESILRSVWQLMTEPIYKGIFTGAIEDLKNPFRS
jgi:oxygen-dependent protoporphyrinogen oxidase